MTLRNLAVFPHDRGNRHLHLLSRPPEAVPHNPSAPADPAFRVLLAALLELRVDTLVDSSQAFVAGAAFAAMLAPLHPCRDWGDLAPHVLAAQQYALTGPDPSASPRIMPFHVRSLPAPGSPLDATADIMVGSLLGLRRGPDLDPTVLRDLADLSDAHLRAWLAVHIRHADPKGGDDVFSAAERRRYAFGTDAAEPSRVAADRVFQALPGIRIRETAPDTAEGAWQIVPVNNRPSGA